MIRRILKWNADRREWNRAHAKAWAGATNPGDAGTSLFQAMCEAEIVAGLSRMGIVLTDRQVENGPAPSIRANLAGTEWTLWIHTNAVEIMSDRSSLVRMEDWDAKSPQEFITTFVGKMVSRLGSSSDGSV